ncbi:NAD(P)-binding protein [Sistotremastrum niveocremeum HHB9708]|uniref:NAD(P)-binding protein n=1 Tax=Sistotremastrum niveocremeum HHB9708 TaxID=1314777 RepID=A0A164U8V9_9AGAM|nr:NAD(P)-binding protein [Sistotremastrum niveocremeum HHB9708]
MSYEQYHEINPPPLDDITSDGKPYKPAGKLEGKSAIITGGDSGIGKAVALLFALEGADLTITHLPEEEKDGQDVVDLIYKKTKGTRVVQRISLDLQKEDACKQLVEFHLKKFESVDSLVLNHGTQKAEQDITNLDSQQWLDTFNTNIHSFFFITKAAIPHIPSGGTIIFNASINPSVGHPELVDYTATKGAIVGYARAISNQLVGEKGIRVNVVAPGPIWTPLIPATMSKESKETFGTTTPMGRAGQPVEVATCFVFLASADSGYISGQVIHVNGGTVIA